MDHNDESTISQQATAREEITYSTAVPILAHLNAVVCPPQKALPKLSVVVAASPATCNDRHRQKACGSAARNGRRDSYGTAIGVSVS